MSNTGELNKHLKQEKPMATNTEQLTFISTEQLKLKLEKYELRKKELEFKIAECKARIEAEEMIVKSELTFPNAVESCKAGQQHATTDVAKYEKLIKRVKKFIKNVDPEWIIPEGIVNWKVYFSEAINELEESINKQ
jgi:hypothetical protein